MTTQLAARLIVLALLGAFHVPFASAQNLFDYMLGRGNPAEGEMQDPNAVWTFHSGGNFNPPQAV